MKRIGSFISGVLVGAMLFGGSVAYAAAIIAEPSTHRFFIDGEEVQMTAFKINGNNYVKFRDIGKELDFNVYWDNGVQVDSDSPYTGEAPEEDLPAAVVNEAVAEVSDDEIRDAMVEQINAVRKQYGKSELAVNQSLMAAAQDCSSQLFTYHQNKVECQTVAKHGYPYGFGSNLTVFTGRSGLDIAERAVDNWVNSAGHLQTLLDRDADSVGVGITVDNGRAFCYMFVGKPNAMNPYA